MMGWKAKYKKIKTPKKIVHTNTDSSWWTCINLSPAHQMNESISSMKALDPELLVECLLTALEKLIPSSSSGSQLKAALDICVGAVGILSTKCECLTEEIEMRRKMNRSFTMYEGIYSLSSDLTHAICEYCEVSSVIQFRKSSHTINNSLMGFPLDMSLLPLNLYNGSYEFVKQTSAMRWYNTNKSNSKSCVCSCAQALDYIKLGTEISSKSILHSAHKVSMLKSLGFDWHWSIAGLTFDLNFKSSSLHQLLFSMTPQNLNIKHLYIENCDENMLVAISTCFQNGLLSNIESISLRKHELNYNLPTIGELEFLKGISCLKKLCFQSCNMKGDISVLSHLTQLEHIELHAISVVGNIEYLSRLPLPPSSPSSLASSVAHIGSMKNLKFLKLRNLSQVVGDISCLGLMSTKLEHVDIGWTGIYGDVKSILFCNPKLRQLDLKCCKINWLLDQNLQHCRHKYLQNLQVLDVTCCDVRGDVSFFKSLLALKVLVLNYTKVQGSLSSFSELVNLEELAVAWTEVEGDTSCLGGLTRLSKLNISNAPGVRHSRPLLNSLLKVDVSGA
jgi:hypothetical protein